MAYINKIGVVVLFVIVLVSVVKISPRIMADDDVKELLRVRVTEIEAELEQKNDELRMLKKTAETSEDKAKRVSVELQKQKTEIEDRDSTISKINKEIEELQEKYQKELSIVDAQSGVKINSRFMKVAYQKSDPEYEKVTYTANGVNSDHNKLIIMASIANNKAYGGDRTFDDFLKLVRGMEYDKAQTTLGLLVGDKEEFKSIQKTIEGITDEDFFSKVIVIQSEFLEKLHKLDREDRHKPKFQKQRRRAIARSRNFLMTNTLTDETYTLCLDSDMVELPKDMISIFEKSALDIVTPRIRHDRAVNYDFNAWSGERTEPNEEESQKLDNNDPEFVYVPHNKNVKHMGSFLDGANGNDGSIDFKVPLDSVGGAVLFLKSVIFKQGVNFPPFYLIGTKWKRFEGFDGIETEGLCYQARTIGYSCWGLPNLVAVHTVDVL